MGRRWIVAAASALALTGCSEDYTGFCEEVLLDYSQTYDKFEITDVIDYTKNDEPSPEVYIRFDGMSASGFIHKGNLSCTFDMNASGRKAERIVLDGRPLPEDRVAQYNATLK